jgi:hypothetical protein
MRIAEIERVIPQRLIIRTDIQHDRQALRRVDPRTRRIESQLADGNTHAVGTEISQTQDAFSIRHDDDLHIILRPVVEYRADRTTIVRRHIEPAWAAEDMRELAAGLADRGRIDQRHNLLDMLADQPVVETLIPVLQGGEEDILLNVARFAAHVFKHAIDLCIHRCHSVRQQPSQAHTVAFLPRESGRLGRRCINQIVPAGSVTDHLHSLAIGRSTMARECPAAVFGAN